MLARPPCLVQIPEVSRHSAKRRASPNSARAAEGEAKERRRARIESGACNVDRSEVRSGKCRLNAVRVREDSWSRRLSTARSPSQKRAKYSRRASEVERFSDGNNSPGRSAPRPRRRVVAHKILRAAERSATCVHSASAFRIVQAKGVTWPKSKGAASWSCPRSTCRDRRECRLESGRLAEQTPGAGDGELGEPTGAARSAPSLADISRGVGAAKIERSGLHGASRAYARGDRAREREWPHRRAFGSRQNPYGVAAAALGGKEKRMVALGCARLQSSNGTMPAVAVSRHAFLELGIYASGGDMVATRSADAVFFA